MIFSPMGVIFICLNRSFRANIFTLGLVAWRRARPASSATSLSTIPPATYYLRYGRRETNLKLKTYFQQIVLNKFIMIGT